MNKWDSLFGGLAFCGGYICAAYKAPVMLTVIIAALIGIAWAFASNIYDYRRGLLKISRPRKTASLDEQVDEAIEQMEKNCRRYRRRPIRPRVNRP